MHDLSKRLMTEDMMQAAIAEYNLRLRSKTIDVLLQVAELNEKIKVFESVVWFPRLQAMVNGTSARGMRGKCRGIDVLTWCCAGRCLVQFDRQGHRLTLITADDEKPWSRDMAHVAPGMGPMGIQSIDADHLEALKMLYEATRWGGEITLEDDENVSIG